MILICRSEGVTEMPKIGDRVQFVPGGFTDGYSEQSWQKDLPRVVTGQIVYINAAHRYYDTEYEVNGYKLHEAFKF